MTRSLVIAVDGPSGSGKSSVSREVARRLGARYLDTGAMYRAATLWFLQHDVDVHDPDQVRLSVGLPLLEMDTDPQQPSIRLDGVDVGSRIREADVTAAVSYVSAVPELRARLVELQRTAVADAIGTGFGIVVEGRDIGRVVLPDADVKIFLTADVDVRAERRHREEVERGSAVDAAGAMSSITDRDAIDTTRAASPLLKAEDAVVIDATELGIEDVVGLILELADARDLRH